MVAWRSKCCEKRYVSNVRSLDICYLEFYKMGVVDFVIMFDIRMGRGVKKLLKSI